MNWNEIKRFNFTYALPGGAWLEDATGNRDWFSFKQIIAHLGQAWLDKQQRKQGMLTGCWITCDEVAQ